ncbi:hypothetical protein P7K49_013922, partial [Saguinus oedipus]
RSRKPSSCAVGQRQEPHSSLSRKRSYEPVKAGCETAAVADNAEAKSTEAPAFGWCTMDEAGSSATGGGFRPGVDSLDEPPNSRIFLVISKYTPESVLRERFSPFGDIQDIWVVRDKHTKESKGIAFVKFARSSQACRAMEEMHGQCLGPNDTKPIKVPVPGGPFGPPFTCCFAGVREEWNVRSRQLTRQHLACGGGGFEERLPSHEAVPGCREGRGRDAERTFATKSGPGSRGHRWQSSSGWASPLPCPYSSTSS